MRRFPSLPRVLAGRTFEVGARGPTLPDVAASAPKLEAGGGARLLQAWRNGDDLARDRLIPLLYHELRRRAAGYPRRERRGHTLRPTHLVHRTYPAPPAHDPA